MVHVLVYFSIIIATKSTKKHFRQKDIYAMSALIIIFRHI